MSLRPLGDRIVVRPVKEEERTIGGIVLPDTAKKKPQRGEVLAVGPGRRLENGELVPVAVSKGDQVVFSSYAGTEVTVDGEELLIMSESDVLAVVTEAQR